MFPIVSESEINGTVTLDVAGDENAALDAFRVYRFDERETAEIFRAEFAPYVDSYAIALRTALPVRERPDRLSARVYRLRDGEIVKIIGRMDEPSDEAGFVDYWYEVLTREGIRGWAFGYFLELTDSAGIALQPVPDRTQVDRLLDDVTSRDWRPGYFTEMISARQVDLQLFDPRFGFFPDPEGQSFELVLPTHRKDFPYEEYFSPRRDTIEFENTSLIIRVVSDREIVVQYNVNGQELATNFVDIDQDLEEVILAERERRDALLQEFLARGNVLVSSAYGEIALGSDGGFVWQGFERLVPRVLPGEFRGTGRLVFSLFIDDALRDRYDGALVLQLPGGSRVSFLYTLSDGGLRTVFVPEERIENATVVGEPLTPVVVFFSFVKS